MCYEQDVQKRPQAPKIPKLPFIDIFWHAKELNLIANYMMCSSYGADLFSV